MTPPPARVGAIVAALAEVRPDLTGTAPEPLGSGLEHDAYRLGDLVVRVTRGDEPGMAWEAALLALVGRRCTVPVPAPVVVRDTWMAYPALPGRPMITLAPAEQATLAPAVAATLAVLLAELWAIPAGDAAALVEDDTTPLEDWRDEAAEIAAQVAGELPPPVRDGVERFLGAAVPPPAPERVLSHNDLGAEHVLVDPERGAVTGVIDWSDAAIVDPAKDLGLVLRDLGPDALGVALRAAGPVLASPAGLRDRALLYARCLTLEDLLFGLETGAEDHLAAARRAARRLFADEMR